MGQKTWQLKDREALSMRAWEDGCVVYQAISGDTHYLTGLASLIFLRLAEGPATLDQLRQRIDASDEPSHTLEEVLSELAKRGLIEWT